VRWRRAAPAARIRRNGRRVPRRDGRKGARAGPPRGEKIADRHCQAGFSSPAADPAIRAILGQARRGATPRRQRPTPCSPGCASSRHRCFRHRSTAGRPRHRASGGTGWRGRGGRVCRALRTARTAGADRGRPGYARGNNRQRPLRLAHTDWLHHRLRVTGAAAELAAFQAAAAGAGVISWQLDPDRLAEDSLHLLVAPPPPPPRQRRLSLAGARILAGQLRDVVARRHDLAVARVGRSRASPFDLHALVPVPADVLRRGPDDPFSLEWLWQHWGTTRELRHVTDETVAAAPERRRGSAAGAGELRLRFWAADWPPWRALARIEAGCPALRFALCPEYDPP
jgi:hypothetical protein